MARVRWRELARRFPVWQLLFPWNCLVGFYLCSMVLGWALTALHLRYPDMKAVGLEFDILAARQVWILSKPVSRRHGAACLLLAIGYVLVAFPLLVDPAQLRLPDAFYLDITIGGTLACLVALVIGRRLAAPGCCTSILTRE